MPKPNKIKGSLGRSKFFISFKKKSPSLLYTCWDLRSPDTDEDECDPDYQYHQQQIQNSGSVNVTTSPLKQFDEIQDNLTILINKLVNMSTIINNASFEMSEKYLNAILKLHESLEEIHFVLKASHYLKFLEDELQDYKHQVRNQLQSNKTLQRSVIDEQGKWITQVHKCEILNLEIYVYHHLLSLNDPNYLFTTLNNQLPHFEFEPYTFNLQRSSIPWIFMSQRPSTNILFGIQKFLVQGDYIKAGEKMLDYTSCLTQHAISFRSQSLTSKMLAVPEIVDFMALITSYTMCGETNENITTKCLLRATEFLINPEISNTHSSVNNNLQEQIKNGLLVHKLSDYEWSVLLETFRKLCLMYWRNGYLGETIQFIDVLLQSQSIIQTNTTKDSLCRHSFLSTCTNLILAQMLYCCMKSMHLEFSLNMHLLEQSMVFMELAFNNLPPMNRTNEAMNLFDQLRDSTPELWCFIIECMCYQCVDSGHSWDVLLLAIRMLSAVDDQIGRPRMTHFCKPSEVINLVLCAEKEIRQKDSANKEYSSHIDEELEVILESLNSHQTELLESYLQNLNPFELPLGVERILQESLLVLREKKWMIAALIFDWWLNGCQLCNEIGIDKRKLEAERSIRISKYDQENSGFMSNKTSVYFLQSVLRIIQTRNCSYYPNKPNTTIRINQLYSQFSAQVSNYFSLLGEVHNLEGNAETDLSFRLKCHSKLYFTWKACQSVKLPRIRVEEPNGYQTFQDTGKQFDTTSSKIRNQLGDILKLENSVMSDFELMNIPEKFLDLIKPRRLYPGSPLKPKSAECVKNERFLQVTSNSKKASHGMKEGEESNRTTPKSDISQASGDISMR